MGRSMAKVDPDREPPDAVFDHLASKRQYQISRKDGGLWHRELLLAGQPDEVVLSEYPLKYVVGSGRHAQSYLVEVDGFLVESPVTWYTSRQAWGMSPGYGGPNQRGFRREVDEHCLFCHAGKAEAVGGSINRMHFTEIAIGCERCHGPGGLHVERHAGQERLADSSAVGEVSDTIVNPARLPRELAEAVCQQCHLLGKVRVATRGRKLSDFRPGLPLQDFCQDYELEGPDESMTVVGHVGQMHRSRCYQSSGTLTCVTCHTPHDEPQPEVRDAYYNSICLDCHGAERCTVGEPRLRRESPQNNCVHCHMPSSATEVPHVTFTDHRIGLHDKSAVVDKDESDRAMHARAVLRPMLDLARLNEVDRSRSLGLAYLRGAAAQSNAPLAATFRDRARTLLSAAHAAGLRDPVLDISLARLREEFLPYVEDALADPDLVGHDRCNALILLADEHVRHRRYEDAAVAMRQVTELTRRAADWLKLAECEPAGSPAAVQSLETAVRIDVRLWQVHQYLAEHYRRQGDLERAAWHQQRAVP
jgi:predicted CXXCH cytochrome family protein